MCNLYSQTRAPDAVRRLFRVPHNRSTEIRAQPAIFPRSMAPIIYDAVMSGEDARMSRLA